MIEGSGFGSIPLTNKSGTGTKRPKKSESSGSGFGSATLGQIVKKRRKVRESIEGQRYTNWAEIAYSK
jgi:hypothetical protein